MEASEEQRKKRRVGEGAPCESRKTFTLIFLYVLFFLYSFVNRRTLQVLLVHLNDVPITGREADRGCASANDPGGNRGA